MPSLVHHVLVDLLRAHPRFVADLLVIGPDQLPAITDKAQAWQNPELTILSALAHGNRVPAVLPAAAQALSAVDTALAEVLRPPQHSPACPRPARTGGPCDGSRKVS